VVSDANYPPPRQRRKRKQYDIYGLTVKVETQLIDLSITLKQTLQLIEQLEARVAALEAKAGEGE
jgi:hypothetical protein